MGLFERKNRSHRTRKKKQSRKQSRNIKRRKPTLSRGKRTNRLRGGNSQLENGILVVMCDENMTTFGSSIKKGLVNNVVDGGFADNHGVKFGMRYHKIDDEEISRDADDQTIIDKINEKKNKNAPFSLTFWQTPDIPTVELEEIYNRTSPLMDDTTIGYIDSSSGDTYEVYTKDGSRGNNYKGVARYIGYITSASRTTRNIIIVCRVLRDPSRKFLTEIECDKIERILRRKEHPRITEVPKRGDIDVKKLGIPTADVPNIKPPMGLACDETFGTMQPIRVYCSTCYGDTGGDTGGDGRPSTAPGVMTTETGTAKSLQEEYESRSYLAEEFKARQKRQERQATE